MKKLNKFNSNRAITLIALIITIIVMLILVAVSISIALNTGLFDSAGKATQKWDAEQEKEQELGSGQVIIGNKNYDLTTDFVEDLTDNKEMLQPPKTYYKSFKAGENVTAYLVENETATQINGTATYDMLFIGTGEIYSVSQWYLEVGNRIPQGTGSYAYYWDIILENVEISYGITNITDSLKYNGIAESGLVSITIPSTVETILSGGFYRCTSLKTVTISSGVRKIEYGAFSECTNLTTINYTGTREEWNKISIEGNNEALESATINYEYQM